MVILLLNLTFAGTFAVACLMVGSAVTKGYNSVMSAESGSIDPAANTTNNDTVLPPNTEEEAMSDKELNIRLQYAMSVSFMVGVIQVRLTFFFSHRVLAVLCFYLVYFFFCP